METAVRTPRIVLAAHKGGAGKTLLSVGLSGALTGRGLRVASFKKGPDYIDAGWLGLASGGDCLNLDAFLMKEDVWKASFAAKSLGADFALVEGNRGLYDGVDAQGSFSTAEMAKSLESPVIIVIDCGKMTRTAAAVALGCRMLDPSTHIAGIILNRVAGARHERVLRESIVSGSQLPVLGAVPKMAMTDFPQRHLGLLPRHEHPAAGAFIQEAAEIATRYLDIEGILEIARSAPIITVAGTDPYAEHPAVDGEGIRICVLRDSAFQFYYPENLEALERTGAKIVETSALESSELPDVDALYIGGGFPETHADRLADNRSFRESVHDAVRKGLPVYAECGGLMYLSRSLVVDETMYPMVGVFPFETELERNPQGHGYIRAEVTGENPFYPRGAVISGHEFHYSMVRGLRNTCPPCAFTLIKGHGLDGTGDGVTVNNVLATYVHVHALGEPLWAKGLVEAARVFRGRRRTG